MISQAKQLGNSTYITLSGDLTIDIRGIHWWVFTNAAGNKVVSINAASAMASYYRGLALYFKRDQGTQIQIKESGGSVLVTLESLASISYVYLGVDSNGDNKWYTNYIRFP